MKRFVHGCLFLVVCIIIAASVQIGLWYYCQPQTVGSYIETEQTDLGSIAESWFEQYEKSLFGFQVSYKYRLKDCKIDKISVLDEQTGFVEIDFYIKPVSENEKLINYYECTVTDDCEEGFYKCQYVLQFEPKTDSDKTAYEVIQKIRPVQYQIMTDPDIDEKTDATPYLMADKDCTYAFSDKQLYVTYDHGKNFVEVPIDYDSIAKTNNGTYDEYIPDSACVITESFTAFVGFSGQDAFLFYSTDAGASWNNSHIADIDFRSSPFVSKTETKCYVSFAVDRALGHDYYVTFETSDFKNWQALSGDAFNSSSYTCIYFTHDNVGYICPELYSQYDKCIFYYTEDNGATITEITLDPPSETVNKLGYNPFVSVENIYVENGVIYAIVRQDDMGDYSREGKFVKALYTSDDGINFKFDSEIFNEPVQAG